MSTLDWLLDSDPAVCWQAMRDLTDAAPEEIAAVRARVPGEGLAAQVLAAQGADGAWHRGDKPNWLPTLFTALLLRATGADPAAPVVDAAMERLSTGFHWHARHGGKTFFEGETEPCINGHTLALGAYFGRPSAALLRRLLREQLDDGGWNCDAPEKSKVSSFHSTICVLEGLLEYERAVGASPEITAARARGEEYLLARHLFRRLSTGGIADKSFVKIGFPPRYRYDVLRALDYLRSAGFDARDPRIAEAVEVVRGLRQADGRWLLDRSANEVLAFPFVETVGEPSRWNTLRALRVLRWVESA